MNIGGGEAADQMVRMMLSGGEVAVRLGGSALKNMLALSMALAKKHKLLYSSIHSKDGRGKLIDVVLPVTELDRANLIFERIKQFQDRSEQEVPERDPARPRRDAPERQEAERRGQEEVPPPEVPPPEMPQQEPSGGSPLRPDSPDTRTNSTTPAKVKVTKMTSERPSIEARLKEYQEQLKKAPTPVKAKAKAKAKNKIRPKAR